MKEFCLLFAFFIFSVFQVFSNELPDDYYVFRDEMYNFSKTPEELERDIQESISAAHAKFSGYELNLVLARYEYIIGRAYAYDKQKAMAEKHFDAGMDYGEKAADEKDTAQARLIFAENVCGNCGVKPFSWLMVWGMKVNGLAKKVIELDKKNGAAYYMLNTQDVYAPKAFSNYKRGTKELAEILNNPDIVLEKDDEFNVLSAIGYANFQQKKYDEAKVWFEKSLEIYPGNKFVLDLMKEIK